MSKKISIILGLVILISMLISACQPVAPAAPAEPAQPAEPAEAEPEGSDADKMGGTIRFAFAEESRGLDPVTAHRRFSEAAVHVHDALVGYDVDNNAYGYLAESWSVNDDATEYTIKLKENVVFHDGTKLTSKDVKAHIDRVFDPTFCCGNAYQYLGTWSETEMVDDYTLKIKFSEPWGPFGYYIGMLDVTGIPSSAAWEAKGDKMNQEPVGAGPFKFVEWVPQSHISYERFDEYNWGSEMFKHSGAPYVDGLQVKFIADAATRTACLESGDCDIIKAPAYTDLQRLMSNSDFKVERIPQTGMPFSFVFNTARFPTDDVNVRKAINLAIDREKLTMAAFLGMREPLYTTLAPATPEYWPGSEGFVYFDADEAKQILADAGWADANGDGILEKDGEPLRIELFVFGSKEANPSVIAAEAIQSDLKAVGVDCVIDVRPWDDQSVIAMKEEHHLINFDMPLPTGSVLGVMFNSRETPREDHYGMGFTWFQKADPALSAELDQLLDAGDNGKTLEERQEHYFKAQEIIQSNYLGLPIAQGYTDYAMVKNLMDVVYNSAGHAMFNDAYFEK